MRKLPFPHPVEHWNPTSPGFVGHRADDILVDGDKVAIRSSIYGITTLHGADTTHNRR
jgi:hypothetical protein